MRCVRVGAVVLAWLIAGLIVWSSPSAAASRTSSRFGLGSTQSDGSDRVRVHLRAGRRAGNSRASASALDARPARKAAIEARDREAQSSKNQPDGGQGGHRQRRNPFSDQTFSDDGRRTRKRGCPRPSRPRIVRKSSPWRTRFGATSKNRQASPPTAMPSFRPSSREPRSCCPRSIHRAAHRLPHARVPQSPSVSCSGIGVHPPLHSRRADRHQHDHALARVEIKPSSASTTRSSSSRISGSSCTKDSRHAMRYMAGGATIFAGLTMAVLDFGLDFVTKLGIGSALGAANSTDSLLIAVLAKLGHKVDRCRSLDPIGRLRGGAREDAHRPLGSVRDRAREAWFSGSCWRSAAPQGRGRSCGSVPRIRARSRRTRSAYDWPWPRTTVRSRSSSTSTAIRMLRSGSTTASATSRASHPRASRSSTTRRLSRSCSSRRTTRSTRGSTGLRNDVVPTATTAANAPCSVAGLKDAFGRDQ